MKIDIRLLLSSLFLAAGVTTIAYGVHKDVLIELLLGAALLGVYIVISGRERR